MDDCLFCKIIAGDIPSAKVYEDEYVYAFRDINPQADEITAENSVWVARCFEAIAKIAKAEGLGSGYRVINNCGADGGQTVMHLHFHILGGEKFSDKMI